MSFLDKFLSYNLTLICNKGPSIENKSLYRFVIYMSFLDKSLSYNLTRLAEIYDDLSENMRFQKLHFYNTTQIDTTMRTMA